jgi:ABC-type transporter Mla MlaB component
VSDDEGGLSLSGELDLDQVDVLSRVVAEHVDAQRSAVLLLQLMFIDSSGLRAILGFASTVPDGVVLRDAPWNVRVVFNLAASTKLSASGSSCRPTIPPTRTLRR